MRLRTRTKQAVLHLRARLFCFWQIEIDGLSKCLVEAGQIWVTSIQLDCATLQCGATGRLMSGAKYRPDSAERGLEVSTKGFKSIVKTSTQRWKDFQNKRKEGELQTSECRCSKQQRPK